MVYCRRNRARNYAARCGCKADGGGGEDGAQNGPGGMALGDVRLQGWQWSEGQPVVCMRSRVKDHTTRGECGQGQR